MGIYPDCSNSRQHYNQQTGPSNSQHPVAIWEKSHLRVPLFVQPMQVLLLASILTGPRGATVPGRRAGANERPTPASHNLSTKPLMIPFNASSPVPGSQSTADTSHWLDGSFSPNAVPHGRMPRKVIDYNIFSGYVLVRIVAAVKSIERLGIQAETHVKSHMQRSAQRQVKLPRRRATRQVVCNRQ